MEHYKVLLLFLLRRVENRKEDNTKNRSWHGKEQESRKEERWKEEMRVVRREVLTVVSGVAKQGCGWLEGMEV